MIAKVIHLSSYKNNLYLIKGFGRNKIQYTRKSLKNNTFYKQYFVLYLKQRNHPVYKEPSQDIIP